MLEVVRDVVKSKTMIMVMVFIVGVSYISATMNKNFDSVEQSSVLQTQIN